MESPNKKDYLKLVNSRFFFFGFAIDILIFAIIEFAYQYFINEPNFETALIRSASFTGATLISLSLLSSIIFKWKPRLAKFWKIRKWLGVYGFIFAAIHVQSIYYFYYNFNFLDIYYSFNPLDNPIIFGTIAYMILFVMALTSFKKLVKKLGRRWKKIHRFVYIAFPAMIFHYLLTNPEQVKTLPGILLSIIIFITVLGQLFWFFRTINSRHYKTKGTLVGTLLIIAFIIIAFLSF